MERRKIIFQVSERDLLKLILPLAVQASLQSFTSLDNSSIDNEKLESGPHSLLSSLKCFSIATAPCR